VHCLLKADGPRCVSPAALLHRRQAGQLNASLETYAQLFEVSLEHNGPQNQQAILLARTISDLCGKMGQPGGWLELEWLRRGAVEGCGLRGLAGTCKGRCLGCRLGWERTRLHLQPTAAGWYPRSPTPHLTPPAPLATRAAKGVTYVEKVLLAMQQKLGMRGHPALDPLHKQLEELKRKAGDAAGGFRGRRWDVCCSSLHIFLPLRPSGRPP
jgi:hypothetical protein